jgi:uncharacterized protein (TIGR03382 family)
MRLPALVGVVLGVSLFVGAAWADVPPGTPYVESVKHPIRVYYAAPAPKLQADTLLKELDAAWDVEIDQVGFAAPLRVLEGNIVQGFHMLVTKTGPTTAYTFEVLGDDPATPTLDCPTLGIANTDFLKSGNYSKDCAWHLLNHASLHAVDCLETSVPANDIITIGLQMCYDAVPQDYQNLENQAFQNYPEYALNGVGFTQDDMFYSFGSSMYALFLEERYGQRDGKLLVELWTHTPQDGHVLSVDTVNTELITADVPNSPNWFDAIATTLTAKGTTFDAAYQEFGLWRLLVSDYSDGKHFKDAPTYPLPAFQASYDPSTLPVTNLHPTKLVGRYGSSYTLVDTSTLGKGNAVKMYFAGASQFHWAAQAVCVLDGAAAEVTPIPLPKNNTGTVYVPDASRCKALVLAVQDLSDGPVNPDDLNNKLDGDYFYSLAVTPMPTVTSVTPQVLLVGTTGASLTVAGTGFVGNVAAGFSGAGLSVTKASATDNRTIALIVDVAADAPVGPRDLTVTNGYPLSATLAGAVTVEVTGGPDASTAAGPDASAQPEADASAAKADTGTVQPGVDAGASKPDNSGGCSCTSTGAAAPAALLAMMALVGLVRRRR